MRSTICFPSAGKRECGSYTPGIPVPIPELSAGVHVFGEHVQDYMRSHLLQFGLVEYTFTILSIWFSTMAYLAYGAIVMVLWFVTTCVYNVFFHPLKAIPGPLMAKISRGWIFGLEMRGNPHVEILDLHRKYGMVSTIDDINYMYPRTNMKHSLTRNRTNVENLTKRNLNQ